MLVDERNILFSAGNGGNGVVHWHREKFLPKGGPDGGNGGDGGSAYFIAVRDINALNRLRENEELKAEDGAPGKGALCSGKNGGHYFVNVPIGSVIINKNTNEKFEMIEEGQKVLVAAGGRGGLGNAHFKSSVNTTPKEFTAGEKAQVYEFNIELHLIADVGIIGLPNVGKSTLLNEITNANAQVANYPFTTLEPNLAVFYGYVLADIPGLIENASSGKGLGYKFLRHITRTRMLVHLVSANSENPFADYDVIRKELKEYEPELLNKYEIIILSKIDTVSPEKVDELLKVLPKGTIPISAYDDESIKVLIKKLTKALQNILPIESSEKNGNKDNS